MKDGGKTITICFTNNKGGSGKSTSCSNLGYELSLAGRKVLLVDGDMQLNLSLSFFDEETALDMAENGKNLYEAVRHKQDLQDYIVHTPYENLDLIPSSILMSQVEYELFAMVQREFILKKCLKTIVEKGEYDFILIDAPPTLGAWVINILCASDFVIVPVEASPWGFFGLANMFDFLNDIQDIADASVMGVLITKVDERKNYYRHARGILDAYDGIHVFDTFIHVDSTVEWAQDNSKPVAVYKKNTRSALEYRKLAEEVIRYGSGKR
ncbi:ParA family protein [bacterium C-53]|nr:ParA family protein [Lachnospiraceae bacterium]NBI03437.1 ParA family protein [Lachnospiraceae bacterium]RKJ09677.1 ParA family protein [bacterium C-53]